MSGVLRPSFRPVPAASPKSRAASAHDYWSPDVRAVQAIDAVPRILEMVCRLTGMGCAVIGRVTESNWTCCAVRDTIDFGMKPGNELDLASTICNDIRQSRQPVVIDEVALNVTFADHPGLKMCRLQSYIAVPIVLKDKTVFGTLCAVDRKPATLNNPATIGTMNLFAELIACHLDFARSVPASIET